MFFLFRAAALAEFPWKRSNISGGKIAYDFLKMLMWRHRHQVETLVHVLLSPHFPPGLPLLYAPAGLQYLLVRERREKLSFLLVPVMLAKKCPGLCNIIRIGNDLDSASTIPWPAIGSV